MSLYLRTDVTAVKLYREFILAGIGSHVNIFCKSSNELLKRQQLFKGHKIHGFVPCANLGKILVYGGKQFIVISINTTGSTNVCIESELVECDDWLYSAIWINDDEVAVLTAHNIVQIWNTSNVFLTSTFISRNNSILYSGLLTPLQDDVLVFAGTVFSEVIIHSGKRDKQICSLKGHRGVIFSIAYNVEKETIVTTSDDRSVRIWSPNNHVDYPRSSHMYWKSINLVCKHELYGHLARVMRSIITREFIISVGEDGAICYWNFNGELIKKKLSHQSGCIWAVDADEAHLVTGGGDASVILHPLTVNADCDNIEPIPLDCVIKKIAFTAQGNVVILCENDDLVYYSIKESTSSVVCKLKQESTYKLLATSLCKQIISVVDMCGNLDVFIEHCKVECLTHKISLKLEMGKVFSMHWAGNRHIAICSDYGNVNVVSVQGSTVNVFVKFTLPPCKERWLTAAALDPSSNIFVFGDRCGNMHFYKPNQSDPIKTFRKVHGRYGPTSISVRNKTIITTGRDGTVQYFLLSSNIKHMNDIDLNFQWVEKFLDKQYSLVCGFQERIFTVFDLRHNNTVLEICCGGGHRTWDASRCILKMSDNYEEILNFVYLKNATLFKAVFQMSKIVSTNVLRGSHIKEINCLQVYQPECDERTTFFISGGEDTTLRISSLINEKVDTFQDKLIFKHLSNLRCIKIHKIKDNKLLLIYGGGRAQVCIKILQFNKEDGNVHVISEILIDYLIKGTDKERKGDRNWRNCEIDFDPETRIMCLDVIELNDNELFIFAGCSDCLLRVFKLTYPNNNSTFETIANLKFHNTCILKTEAFKIQNEDFLVTATTRGVLAFWNVFPKYKISIADMEPMCVIDVNKSGINCLSLRVTNTDEVLVATGGDDNALHILKLKYDLNTFTVMEKWSTDQYHCSLISGVRILDANQLLSVSIDQRVTLSSIVVTERGLEGIFLCQVYSDVPDIQGLDIIEQSSNSVTVCVYGKGLEIIVIPIPR